MNASLPRLTRFADGITAVDTEYVRPQMDAAHVVAANGRAVIVDTGPNSAVPLILAALDELRIARDAVDLVLLTHVHLDHAGGAGALMNELPNARAVLHPRGAPHMSDPAKLVAGTRAVYGDELFAQLYGEVLPIPAARIETARDGQKFDVAGRVFECVHTPGHALHHQAFVDHGAGVVFTGDTFGISYRELDSAAGPWIMPTTTPTQFDPEQLKASVRRIMQYQPRRLYLTHYSEVGNCARLAHDMVESIDEFVRIARGAGGEQQRIRDGLRRHAHESLREHGCRLDTSAIDELLGKDFDLNAAGLIAWLQRERA